MELVAAGVDAEPRAVVTIGRAGTRARHADLASGALHAAVAAVGRIGVERDASAPAEGLGGTTAGGTGALVADGARATARAARPTVQRIAGERHAAARAIRVAGVTKARA